MENKKITIAIDGPVGSGKGTLAKELAKKLGFLYVYTGAMYRVLALSCIRNSVDVSSEDQVLAHLKSIKIDLQISGSESRVLLNSQDVTEDIFLPEVGNLTPKTAAFPKVRKEMVEEQKEIIKGKNCVVEGRDIATDVAPEAQLKIYLTADIEARAKRRFDQFRERGISTTFEEVLQETIQRDKTDQNRKASPLSVSSESVVIDTTNDKIQDTVEKVMQILRNKGLINEAN